jgi:4'-phosphopantetheinyl transferase
MQIPASGSLTRRSSMSSECDFIDVLSDTAIRTVKHTARSAIREINFLARGVAHVWLVDLRAPSSAFRENTLSDAERARASRFVFACDRKRFIASHCALREILAHYTSQSPSEIAYDENAFGKPTLTYDAGRRATVTFSLSHSKDIAAVAVSTSSSIGVDVEICSLPQDYLGVARTVFSPEENRAITDMPLDRHARAFFTCWTRKEAYLKALGVGFSSDPTLVNVGVSPALRALPSTEMQSSKEAIFVQTVCMSDEYIVSLAMTDEIAQIKHFHFSLNKNETTLLTS